MGAHRCKARTGTDLSCGYRDLTDGYACPQLRLCGRAGPRAVRRPRAGLRSRRGCRRCSSSPRSGCAPGIAMIVRGCVSAAASRDVQVCGTGARVLSAARPRGLFDGSGRGGQVEVADTGELPGRDALEALGQVLVGVEQLADIGVRVQAGAGYRPMGTTRQPDRSSGPQQPSNRPAAPGAHSHEPGAPPSADRPAPKHVEARPPISAGAAVAVADDMATTMTPV